MMHPVARCVYGLTPKPVYEFRNATLAVTVSMLKCLIVTFDEPRGRFTMMLFRLIAFAVKQSASIRSTGRE